MKRAVPIALILLAATAFAAAAAGWSSSGPTASRCGGELWRLKTLSDPARQAVVLNPTGTTIAAIGERPFPRPLPRLRQTAFQKHAWEVVAQITKYRVESEGVRLELYDHESYLNAVIPTPDCLTNAARARSDMAVARGDRLRSRRRFLEPAPVAARRGAERRRATPRHGAPHRRRMLGKAPWRDLCSSATPVVAART